MRIDRWVAGALCAVALAFLCVAPASAERRIALVIGNSAYANAQNLRNPRNDAELMAKTLEQVGFEVTKLIDADQRTMKEAMARFGRTLNTDADVSLFYYAGHGVQAKGQNFLIPTDAEVNFEGELDFQAVDVNAFLGLMDKSHSKVNIVVLDACRNNPFESSVRSGSRGLAMVNAPRGTYIAYSTAPGAVAEDGERGNSPYTKALSEAMLEPGLKLEDTFKETRKLVLAATDESQVPWETSSIVGDFYFQRAAIPVVDSSVPNAGDIAFWQSIQHSTNPDDFVAYKRKFPKGMFVELADNRLAAFASDNAKAGGPSTIAAANPEVAGKTIAPDTPAAVVSSAPPPSSSATPRLDTITPKKAEAIALAVSNPDVKLASLGLSAEVLEQAADAVARCDMAAADPDDPDKPPSVGGIDADKVDPVTAISACLDAVATKTDDRHLLFNLGRSYEIAKKIDLARESYDKAAKLGSGRAMNAIGEFYDEGGALPTRYAEARNWYEKAIAVGDFGAMTNMGWLYENGRGVKKNLVTARKWYEKGAAFGCTNGMVDLGLFYHNGLGGLKRDYKQAMYWYQKAVDKGSTSAMLNIGVLYESGSGVKQDYTKAREWYERAAAAGDPNGTKYLAVLSKVVKG